MADSHRLPGPHQHLGAQHEAPDVRASEKCLKNKKITIKTRDFTR
jgi:hypothetical protein